MKHPIPKPQEFSALIIQHQVKQGSKKLYEEWARTTLQHVNGFPGYLRSEIFSPATDGDLYTVIIRFKSQKDARAWLDSSLRKQAIEKMHGVIQGGDQTEVKSGIDFWFPPRDGKQKLPSFKQSLLVMAVIYPLSLIVPPILAPLSQAIPALKNAWVEGFVMTVLLVALMNYLIMPRLTFWLQDWLDDAKKSRAVSS